jgi:DNA-binding NtrC family response regulator
MSVKPYSNVQMQAVAFLYDHLSDFPAWIRRLTPAQLEGIARVMLAWHGTVAESTQIRPLEETEKREISRAITLCQGSLPKAAAALRVGKTTLYRKLKLWGYGVHDRLSIYQASVLSETPCSNQRPHTSATPHMKTPSV